MNVTDVLLRITKESTDQIEKNKIKINNFASKYEEAIQCFYTDDETDDLYDFLFDLSIEYNIPEDEVYYIFVQSKYAIDENDDLSILSKTFDEDFATHITLLETINDKKL